VNTTPSPSIVEIKVELQLEGVEYVSDLLVERQQQEWTIHEDVVTAAAWLIGLFATRDLAARGWESLVQELGSSIKAEPTIRYVPELEWRDSYKRHFHAWQFGRLHWVPVWERESFILPEGHAVLWLDPGLAFGTGNHESTRLCVERLTQYAEAHGTEGSVIDAGCGSGILALSASKLGFQKVRGFDNDPEAVQVSRENALLNGLSDRVIFNVGDLSTGFAGEQASVVLANILGNVLVAFRRELTAAVSPGGVLILSGILAAECKTVRIEFSRIVPNWASQSRVLGEWADVVLTRP
jgi:ribosomal protein L11 methyltransferase